MWMNHNCRVASWCVGLSLAVSLSTVSVLAESKDSGSEARSLMLAHGMRGADIEEILNPARPSDAKFDDVATELMRNHGLREGEIAEIIKLRSAAIKPQTSDANPPALPDTLVQYVRRAKKVGLPEKTVLQEATHDGWTAEAASEAIAYVRNEPVDEAESASHTPPSTVTPVPVEADRQARPAPTTSARVSETASDAEARTKALAANQNLPYDYHIGAGDTLQISVWKEPETSSPSLIVRPDGKISMPLLKEVQVAGLTPTEAEKLIAFRLSKVITDPDVTVVVTGTHSQKVYAIGAIRKEGPIAYTYQMSIMQAISEAGGLTDYAKRKKIYVLRTENGSERKLPFDYDSALKGEDTKLNIQLVPGDTLVVP